MGGRRRRNPKNRPNLQRPAEPCRYLRSLPVFSALFLTAFVSSCPSLCSETKWNPTASTLCVPVCSRLSPFH